MGFNNDLKFKQGVSSALSKTSRLGSKLSRMSYADDGSDGTTVITRGGNSVFGGHTSREGSV
tara:strand:+ start:1164 stop:1349 length:186 start_codon:yes stop_codon:yes gene_type:complete